MESIHVAWHDNTPGNYEILYRNSEVIFEQSTTDLSGTVLDSGEPAIAVSGNNVYVVWEERIPQGGVDIFFRRSTDGGASFGETTDLSENAVVSLFPGIAVSGNNIYVVWRDGSEISYRMSTDGGASFGSTDNLSNNAGFSQASAITASGSNVYVVWTDDTSGNTEILYRRSTDGGASFGSTDNLSNSAGFSFDPAISAFGNNVYVVWSDDSPGNADILFKRSLDSGESFSIDSTNLSNSDGFSFHSSLAAVDNSIFIVWEDHTPGAPDILFKSSQTAGVTFDRTINLSNNDGQSFSPTISAIL
jgi:hypothetical protein